MSHGSDEFEDMAVTIVRVREKSVLLDYEGNEEWIPLSACDERGHDLDENDEGEEREIGIALWVLKDRGWL